MRAFWATVATGLGLIAAVNWTVDPIHRFHRPLVPPAALWSADQALLLPAFVDEQTLRFAHVRLAPKPGVVLLGSSRVIHLDSEAFAPSAAILNLGIGSVTPQDFLAEWQALKDAKKTPARLIVFADPWLFNEFHQAPGWRAGIPLVDEFLRASAVTTARDRWWLKGQDVLGRVDGLTELLSASVLKESWRNVRATDPSAFQLRVVDLATAPQRRTLVMTDGSWLRRGDPAPPPLEEQRRAAVQSMLWGGLTYPASSYRLDARSVRLFRALLADARRQGAEVLVLVPPYHPLVWRYFQQPDYTPMLSDFARVMSDLSAEQGFALCDDMDPARVPCAEEEFDDAVHTNHACLIKLTRACLERFPAWRPLSGGAR